MRAPHAMRAARPAAQASVRSLDRGHAAALGCPAFHDAVRHRNSLLVSYCR